MTATFAPQSKKAIWVMIMLMAFIFCLSSVSIKRRYNMKKLRLQFHDCNGRYMIIIHTDNSSLGFDVDKKQYGLFKEFAIKNNIFDKEIK